MDEYEMTEMESVMNYFPKKMERVISGLGDRYLSGIGLKSYHMPVIRVIYCNDGVDQKTIRETIPFDKSRISVIVRELMDGGFVYDSASGRSSSLHLTDKGKGTIACAIEFRKHIEEDVFSIFTKDEIEYVKKFFLKLDAHLTEMLDPDQSKVTE